VESKHFFAVKFVVLPLSVLFHFWNFSYITVIVFIIGTSFLAYAESKNNKDCIDSNIFGYGLLFLLILLVSAISIKDIMTRSFLLLVSGIVTNYVFTKVQETNNWVSPLKVNTHKDSEEV
jgi:hypothetical protein